MEVRKTRHAVIVGVFVLTAIAILMVTVFTLGGEKKTFTKKFPIKVVFTDINGLKIGNNIWFSGVIIGTVRSINLKEYSKVEVTLSIEEKMRSFIHQDAEARISTDGFLGNKIVILYGGTPGMPEIKSNDLISVHKINPEEDMMSLLNASNKNLLDITNNVKIVAKKIASGEGSLGKLINDPSLMNMLQTTIQNLEGFSANSKKTMAEVDAFAKRMNTEGSSLNRLFTDSTLLDSIKSSVSQIQQASHTANELVNNLNAFSADMKTAGSTLKDSTKPAGMVLNDKEAAQKIDDILQNLESASKKLDEDLEAVQHNFLFRGYFRKKQKKDPAIPDSTNHQ
ncbi:MAG TPA: MlaD family protein [Chitinophagaceae bacterium]|nr:MlaD family protein [Chitinophagaceae bacterium]